MLSNFTKLVVFFLLFLANTPVRAQQKLTTDLLIIGGGASGTMAAVQASRMGVKTILIEETEWLGGMLTSAGVSAIDGNHNLPSGLWGEFREKLYQHYGGPKKVETGWVSNTLFEPSVGQKILVEMAKNPNLQIIYQTVWQKVDRTTGGWTTQILKAGRKTQIRSKLIIDATELGDVMAYLKVPYVMGMDSRARTGEAFAPEKSNDIVQDLTYVVTLKDYGKNADKTIPKPIGYNAKDFECACDVSDPSADLQQAKNDCAKMLAYGRLPNGKYMINWPKCGNDIYMNIVEMSKVDREKALKEAKLHSLRFVYYIQKVLGYKNLGLPDDEYPTADGLPMMPYYRESRRLSGKVNFTVNDLMNPYTQQTALYRTGIAVGDYPIDHHHLKNPNAPKIDFIKIKVPSYSIPLGSLIPANTDGLIVAEKSISVSNIVAGTTRLQPVVLLVGQAAGALAATSILTKMEPANVNIRQVQQALLNGKAYLMPYIDVKPDDKDFASIQRIGASGIIKGTGIAYKWANQTWFYPDSTLEKRELLDGLSILYPASKKLTVATDLVDADFCFKVLSTQKSTVTKNDFNGFLKSQEIALTGPIKRRMIARIVDKFLNPFAVKMDFNGAYQNP
ncbi:FAD-dependent oxidoreductase [Pedobacter yonginense]|uniref:FAD-dependent oxidoreductase n=1 Tax=Pedobacter yonginense TaxID=651869 RepID=A0A317EKD6_9SPHI|nr:FAD-dependent oxidoreductase [Pedobacter yonginense]PWS26313.1 FAD-dependent oxidoreductase [Pedobacter yonginense]